MDSKDSKHLRRIRRANEHLIAAREYRERGVANHDSNAINEADIAIHYYENIIEYYRTHHSQLFNYLPDLGTIRVASQSSVQTIQ